MVQTPTMTATVATFRSWRGSQLRIIWDLAITLSSLHRMQLIG